MIGEEQPRRLICESKLSLAMSLIEYIHSFSCFISRTCMHCYKTKRQFIAEFMSYTQSHDNELHASLNFSNT